MTATPVNEAAIREALRQVVDPELDCNIVDLGLIYDIAIKDAKVTVKMTLATPGCPMHESIGWGVQSALLRLEGVAEAEVDLVWEPPWNPTMMSDFGRARVGIFGYDRPEPKIKGDNMTTQTEPFIGTDKVMDVRPIPCSSKHKLIMQTWRDLRVGDYFILLNDHDPIPLHYQFSAEFPSAFGWEHLEKGPTDYRVKITKFK